MPLNENLAAIFIFYLIKLGILIIFVSLFYSNTTKMNQIMSKSIFYHAGCPVCVSAEHDIVSLIGTENVEIIHLGEDQTRITEAEKAGVKSVPALLTPNGNVLHINFGATIADVKA